MEVRGDVREGCCFLQAMRAIYTTIRDRLRPRRTRQKTKNYRICQNSAMAKMKKKNQRKHLTSGLNSRVFYVANIPPAHVDTAQRRSQKEDGVSGELQERLRSSLRASQERRKPRWVLQRDSKQNSLVDVSVEEAQAKDLQPGEAQHDNSNMEETQTKDPEPAELKHEAKNMEETGAKDLQLGESITEIMSIEETQAGEVLGPAEPAIWVAAHAQMWLEMTEPDPVSWCSMPIMYSGPGSKYPVPPEWALDHLMEVWSSSESENGGQKEPATEATNMAGDDFQPDELNIRLDEQTSWVVAHVQMWQEMTEPDPVSWCNMPIMYSGPGSQYPVPPEWDLDHLMAQWRSSDNIKGEEQ